MHCAKAFIRSELWDPSTWLPETELPSVTQIYRDHRDTPGLTPGPGRARARGELPHAVVVSLSI